VIIRSALSKGLAEVFPVADIFSTADRIRVIWTHCVGLSREQYENGLKSMTTPDDGLLLIIHKEAIRPDLSS
jgi:hypothetical protein